MDLSVFINAALSAAGGGGVVGALVLALYKNNLKKEAEQREAERQERKELSEKLEVLEKEKFAELKRNFDEHVKEAKPRELALQLEYLAEALKENTSLQRENALQIARIDKNCAAGHAELIKEIAASKVWLANLNESVQQHITNGRIHRGN